MRRRTAVVALVVVLAVSMLALILARISSRSRSLQLSPQDIAVRLQGLDPESARAKILRAAQERSGQGSRETQGTGPRFTTTSVALTPSAAYEIRERSGSEEDAKKSTSFIAGIGGTRRLVVTEETYTGPVGDYPAIKMRHMYPETYHEAVLTNGGREVFEFTNTQTEGFEKIIFYQNTVNNTLTTIALTATGAFGREEAAADYDALLPTIEWH